MDNNQVIEYYNEEFILSIINDYLINTFDLYDGQLIDGLSFTMYNVEVIYDNGKHYAITLYVVVHLLEDLVFKKISNHYAYDDKDWIYWKEKLNILIKENVINTERLEGEVNRSIEHNYDEIVSYILQYGNDNDLLY